MSNLRKVKSELSRLEISDAQGGICADIFADAGVKNPAKMQLCDVEPFLSELDSSDASNATIKRAIAWADRNGVPDQVLNAILNSDYDGDGLSLREELRLGTSPHEYDAPYDATLGRFKGYNRQKDSSIEL